MSERKSERIKQIFVADKDLFEAYSMNMYGKKIPETTEQTNETNEINETNTTARDFTAEDINDFVNKYIFNGAYTLTDLQELFFKKMVDRLHWQPETIQHLATCAYMARLASEKYTDEEFVKTFAMSKRDFSYAMAMHDIGKMIVNPMYLIANTKFAPDSIEKKSINTHSYYGAKIVDYFWDETLEEATKNESVKKIAENFAKDAYATESLETVKFSMDSLKTHERYDALLGKGVYSIIQNHHDGVVESVNPITALDYRNAVTLAQIIDIADALVAKRCYKDGKPIDEVIQIVDKRILGEINQGLNDDIELLCDDENCKISESQTRQIYDKAELNYLLECRAGIETSFLNMINELTQNQQWGNSAR